LDPNHQGHEESLPVLIMPQGAHHLDLRGPHPSDPANVTATRALQEQILKKWIDEYVAQDMA
jgi:lysosomal Pro-X carboxypeptidase